MKKQQGFTLIEVLVYLTLFAIIIGGAVVTAYQIIEGSESLQARVIIEEEGNFLLGKITSALSGVQTINSATGGTLTVTKFDGTNFTYSLQGLNFESNQSGTNLALNNSNVNVSSLTFTHLTNPQGVKTDFTLSARDESGHVYSQSFTATKYLRK